MLQSKCSRVSKLLGTESETYWNGAHDLFNYMETRLYLRCNKLQLSNPNDGCIITDLTIKGYFIELEQLNKAS